MDASKLQKKWHAFLMATPASLDTDTIRDLCGPANSADWSHCAVAALAPERCEEMCAITRSLPCSRTQREEWRDAVNKAEAESPLFKVGCAFGEAADALLEARNDNLGDLAESDAHAALCVAWDAVMEQLRPRVTVELDAEDRVELYHMLRGRGGSDLKTRLLDALEILDPKRAAYLRGLED